VPSQTESTYSDRILVHLEGRIDRETVPKIRNELLSSARKSGGKKMELDLSRVSGLDTAGIAMMVEVLRVVSRRNGDLRLSGLNDNAIKMIRLSRLEGVFDMRNHAAIGS